jgi:Ni/Co efflux regulator RcnB
MANTVDLTTNTVNLSTNTVNLTATTINTNKTGANMDAKDKVVEKDMETKVDHKDVHKEEDHKEEKAKVKKVNGVHDVRKAWHPTLAYSPAYREVQKIHAGLVSLAFFAKDFTNDQVADMYANVLIEQKYHGDVPATAGAFNTIFASVRPEETANTVANTGHEGNEWVAKDDHEWDHHHDHHDGDHDHK